MQNQIQHYENKLAYEIDSWDLNEAMKLGEKLTVVDARSAEAYAKGHIHGAVSILRKGVEKCL